MLQEWHHRGFKDYFDHPYAVHFAYSPSPYFVSVQAGENSTG
jgi:hypothetical protein